MRSAYVVFLCSPLDRCEHCISAFPLHSHVVFYWSIREVSSELVAYFLEFECSDRWNRKSGRCFHDCWSLPLERNYRVIVYRTIESIEMAHGLKKSCDGLHMVFGYVM